MTSRDEFEAWLDSPAGNSGLTVFDTLSGGTDEHWLTWQEARKQRISDQRADNLIKALERISELEQQVNMLAATLVEIIDHPITGRVTKADVLALKQIAVKGVTTKT